MSEPTDGEFTAQARGRRIEQILAAVERRVRERPDHGVLDDETVLALDVIMHSLLFESHADALSLWREALWQRRLPSAAKRAIETMLEHIFAAIDSGDSDAASSICNCLQAVVSPDVFRAPLEQVVEVNRG